MATFFFDIDGTIVNYHTNEWLPGVKQKLIQLHNDNHQIIFITMRDTERDNNTVWSVENTHELLTKANFPFKYTLLTNIQSPRILIDDNNIFAIQTICNSANWIEKI